jgi:ketosteroid isomerase-like protein
MRALVGFLMLVATVASAEERMPSVTLPPALDRVLRDYETAWQARDAEKLASLFAEDGFVLASRRPPARGRAAIREVYTNKGGPLALRALDYAMSGNTGWIIGAYGQDASKDGGKFVLALKKVKGRWMIAADIDSGNSPPPPAP